MAPRRSVLRLLGVLAALVVAASSAQGGDGLAERVPSAGQLAPLQLAGAVESFSPETLWERINGEAELYRLYGLAEAAMAYFEDPRDAERGVEVSLFRLADPLGAFGLFAVFRGTGGTPLDLGNGGVLDDYQAQFWQGDLFALFHAFGTDGTRRKDLRRAAQAVSQGLGAPRDPPKLLTRFSGLVRPDSIRYYPDHLFGRATLPPGLSGTHAGGTVLFIGTTGGETLSEYTGALTTTAEPAPGRVTGRDPDLGRLTLAIHNGRLLGVRGDVAEKDLGGLLRRLEETSAVP